MKKQNSPSHEKTLSIQLNSQQIDQVNRWIGEINMAHRQEECEPPGFEIVISFVGPWGQSAEAKCGSATLDLGDVVCNPPPAGWCL